MLEYFLITLAIILTFSGIVGCIFPLIPGPPLNYLAIIILHMAGDKPAFGSTTLIVLAVLTIAVQAAEYLLPILGAKIYGISKFGIRGAVLGMFLGIFVFPPFGIVLGTLAGSIAGELIAGKGRSRALKAGGVTFLYNLLAAFMKLALSFTMTYIFFSKLIM